MALNTTTMHDASQHLDTSSVQTFRVVVAAGGTGGHIFPAIAVVEQLRRQTNENCSALYMGSMDRMETTLIPKLGYPYIGMPIEGFRGLASPSTLLLPFKIVSSVLIARKALRKHKPHAVICTGAYVSYPVGLAASFERVPLFVLESNFNPGKTNARLAPKAARVVLSFDESVKFYRQEYQNRLTVLGNPVRTQIRTDINREEARVALGLRPDKRTILVFGGSLGARSINEAIAKALPTLAEAPYQVLWQTGAKYAVPADLPSNVVARAFIDDMGAAYAASDLVVCRSGATSIAELGIAEKPAILVPLPSASTGEQQHNASVVRDAGAAIVVADKDCAEELMQTMQKLMNDDKGLKQMATSMKSLGRPNAAADTARLILNYCKWPNGAQP